MREAQRHREPRFGRGLIWLAGRIVPPHERVRWRARWDAGMRDWWALIERGEVIFHGAEQVADYCRPALVDAFWSRFSYKHFRRFLRSPLCVLLGLAAILTAAGVWSRGFPGARSIVEIARTAGAPGPNPHEDVIAVHLFSLTFALAIGTGVALLNRPQVLGHGWRYWSFFLWKSASVFAVAAVVWIEAGAWFRARVTPHDYLAITATMIFWCLSMAAFGGLARWCVADQRRRCPRCLHCLSWPVAVGSWGSTLEPAATELLCEQGHGSLSLADADTPDADRWISLGPSWQDLFET